VIELLISIAICGLIIGALARLVVPGRQNMGIGTTILVGLGGSFVGGLVSRLVFGWRYRYSILAALIVSVVCAALIIYALQGRRGDKYR
jgi:uncharacterized membrane protein YeaQ/YmgE (transglycosylase-associated protein family)